MINKYRSSLLGITMMASMLAVIFALLLPSTSQAADAELFFTAPPRGKAKDVKSYEPIAQYLTKKLGVKVTYVPPISWMHYKRDMIKNTNYFHITFDGPHFVSWRTVNLDHIPVAKLPQQHIWLVVARKDDNKTNKLTDLHGYKLCGQAPPNFGTLTVQSHYPHPARQPVLKPTKGWENIYKSVVAGKCVAGVLPITNLQKFDPELAKVKVIHQHHAYPNQAFTVSNKLDPSLRKKIQEALLSKEGQTAMQFLRDRYARGRKLVNANPDEYLDVSNVLDSVYGFGFNFDDEPRGEDYALQQN